MASTAIELEAEAAEKFRLYKAEVEHHIAEHKAWGTRSACGIVNRNSLVVKFACEENIPPRNVADFFTREFSAESGRLAYLLIKP